MGRDVGEGEVPQDKRGAQVGALDRGAVAGAGHEDVLRVRDRTGELRRILRRKKQVVLGADDEGRSADVRQPGTRVHVQQRRRSAKIQ
jgi:hypothetical protein